MQDEKKCISLFNGFYGPKNEQDSVGRPWWDRPIQKHTTRSPFYGTTPLYNQHFLFLSSEKEQKERERLSRGVGGHEQDGGGRAGGSGGVRVVESRRRTTYADVFRMSKGKTCCSKMRRGGSGLHLLPTDDVVTGDISPCNVSVGAAGVINQLQAGARVFLCSRFKATQFWLL